VRLNLETLGRVPPAVQRPAYDVAALRAGIVHLGVGAFHRAHQAVLTDDAIASDGADWGIIGVSMRKPDVAESLTPQDGLYTVEILGAEPQYRVVGAVRQALTLPLQPAEVAAAIAAPTTRIISLTVTEKGYCLSGDTLDLDHPDIRHDLSGSGAPTSAIGVLTGGLSVRRRMGGAPVTVISCDNLVDNGPRLEAAVRAFAERTDPALAAWLDANAAFPQTMVDSIVPASDAASRARCDEALGLTDMASVQREPFAQWVIEDRFAGPRPAWPAGVEIVGEVASYRQLKLHVLNASHSALAYLGLARNHVYVRDGIADPVLSDFLDAMIEQEVAPALPSLPVRDYWRTTRNRFANPMVAHRLDQIAQDGVAKLAERIYPLMQDNLRQGRPAGRMAAVARAWLERTTAGTGQSLDAALADPALFPESFRADPRMAAAVAEARP
jgi:fructuronate reductase